MGGRHTYRRRVPRVEDPTTGIKVSSFKRKPRAIAGLPVGVGFLTWSEVTRQGGVGESEVDKRSPMRLINHCFLAVVRVRIRLNQAARGR